MKSWSFRFIEILRHLCQEYLLYQQGLILFVMASSCWSCHWYHYNFIIISAFRQALSDKMSCHSSCATCSGTAFDQCLSCASTATLHESYCLCSHWDQACSSSNVYFIELGPSRMCSSWLMAFMSWWFQSSLFFTASRWDYLSSTV